MNSELDFYGQDIAKNVTIFREKRLQVFLLKIDVYLRFKFIITKFKRINTSFMSKSG